MKTWPVTLRNVLTIKFNSTHLDFLWLPSKCLGTKRRLHCLRRLCPLHGNEDHVTEASEEERPHDWLRGLDPVKSQCWLHMSCIMTSTARARAEDYVVMAQVGETIATQIATRTDALRGSYCKFKSRLLGFNPRFHISLAMWEWASCEPPVFSFARWGSSCPTLQGALWGFDDVRYLKAKGTKRVLASAVQ